jgi:hypothetical protein
MSRAWKVPQVCFALPRSGFGSIREMRLESGKGMVRLFSLQFVKRSC